MSWGKLIAARIAEANVGLEEPADVTPVTETEDASCSFLEEPAVEPAAEPADEPGDGYQPFDWGPADAWVEKHRRPPMPPTIPAVPDRATA
jgi:hypothetical protein